MHAFAKYEYSGARTCKWRTRYHLAINIQDADCIEAQHGGRYESARRNFKVLDSLTFTCGSEAFYGTIQLRGERDHIHNISDGQLAVGNGNLVTKRAVEIGSQYLAYSSPSYTLFELDCKREHLFGEYFAEPLKNYTATLARFLGDHCLYAMNTLLWGY